MCGCGRTSCTRPGCSVAGPKWSKKTKGPTERLAAAGSRRRTMNPPPRSLSWGLSNSIVGLRCAFLSTRERRGGRCDALAERTRRVEIALGHFGRTGIGGRGGERASIAAHEVGRVAGGRLVVRREDAQADPEAAMLHGQGPEILDGGELVAVHGAAV